MTLRTVLDARPSQLDVRLYGAGPTTVRFQFASSLDGRTFTATAQERGGDVLTLDAAVSEADDTVLLVTFSTDAHALRKGGWLLEQVTPEARPLIAGDVIVDPVRGS